ncbi:CHAT domain-containing protein (plasmid) [Embleya sp. NBC_00888]|uniref:CHAT domain-containing protein n=1 Tax=Embleya sp. NBC_00888 TaxID=2975960 RepID=UPI002F91AFB6|nr:CHAT domain-containing protein [Embleya sp. NBC_00888]
MWLIVPTALAWELWRLLDRQVSGSHLLNRQRLDTENGVLYLPARHTLVFLRTGASCTFDPSTPSARAIVGVGVLGLILGLLAVRMVEFLVAYRRREISGWTALLRRPIRNIAAISLLALPEVLILAGGKLAIEEMTKNDTVGCWRYMILSDPELVVVLWAMAGWAFLAWLSMTPWMADWLLTDFRATMRAHLLVMRLDAAPGPQQKKITEKLLQIGRSLQASPYSEYSGEGAAILMIAASQMDHKEGGEILSSLLEEYVSLSNEQKKEGFRSLDNLTESEKLHTAIASMLVTRFSDSRSRKLEDAAIELLDGFLRRPILSRTALQEGRNSMEILLATLLGSRYSSRSSEYRGDLPRALEIGHAVYRRAPEFAKSTLIHLEILRSDYEKESELKLSALESAISLMADEEIRADLVLAMLKRMRLLADGSDSSEMMSAARQAVEVAERFRASVPAGGENHGISLLYRAEAIWRQGRLAEVPFPDPRIFADLRDAVASPGESAGNKFRAAFMWGHIAAEYSMWHEAVAGYSAAVKIRPQMVWIGLDQDDKRNILSAEGSLCATAGAAAAIADGQLELGVELLEQGRMIIWSQIAGLRDLLPTGHSIPQDARDRLLAIESELGGGRAGEAEVSLLPLRHPANSPEAIRDLVRRLELGQERETLVHRYGLDQRPEYAELKRAAAQGPVVVVNVSSYRCDAIIVLHDRSPVHVPLPDLAIDDIITWANQIDQEGLRKAGKAISRRLWNRLADPVFKAVKPYLGARRRIWWLPTGPLSGLPLHAAGLPGPNPNTDLLTQVVSSYTPSLQALTMARRSTNVPDSPPGCLIVTLRNTPAALDGSPYPPLVEAEADAKVVLGYFPQGSSSHLAEDQGTVDGTLLALPTHAWAHFACHGDKAGIVLHDGILGPPEIASLRLVKAELAFVATCYNATPDFYVSDEMLNVANYMHLGGYRHVIGSLAEIPSKSASRFTTLVYGSLIGHGGLDSSGAAFAVRDAVRELRQRDPDDLRQWGLFIHIGP